MKRRLVKQGATTMMVSLPANWIRANKLEKGSEVELNEIENNLIISKDIKDTIKETEITLNNSLESSVRIIITNLYRENFSRIKINFKDKKSLLILKEIIDDQLLGFEIIKKAENYCIVESITDPTGEQFDNIFSKLLLNIEDLFDLTEQYFLGEKPEFIKTENKIKEFDNLCRRIIYRENYPKSELRVDFHSELIHGQRELYLLLLFLSKNRFKAGKQELELLKESRKTFEMLKETYYNKNLELVENLTVFQNQSYNKAYKELEKSNPVIVHHLMNAIRGFYLAASPLTGIILG